MPFGWGRPAISRGMKFPADLLSDCTGDSLLKTSWGVLWWNTFRPSEWWMAASSQGPAWWLSYSKRWGSDLWLLLRERNSVTALHGLCSIREYQTGKQIHTSHLHTYARNQLQRNSPSYFTFITFSGWVWKVLRIFLIFWKLNPERKYSFRGHNSNLRYEKSIRLVAPVAELPHNVFSSALCCTPQRRQQPAFHSLLPSLDVIQG